MSNRKCIISDHLSITSLHLSRQKENQLQNRTAVNQHLWVELRCILFKTMVMKRKMKNKGNDGRLKYGKLNRGGGGAKHKSKGREAAEKKKEKG